MIPHNQPLITNEDRAAVDAVLRSGWVAQGSQVEALERIFVSRHRGGEACAVSSGTSALFLALKGLGIGIDDEVALPSYACSALLNAVYMAGATPSIVDVKSDSFCLDPVALERQAAKSSCIIAVHTYGEPADIASMIKPSRKLIEDCCQSLGGEGPQGLLGSAGDAAIFSFYATKIITGGQGGLIWASNQTVASSGRDYRQFDCQENYVPRFNLQMTDIQAALINSQMGRLEEIRVRRQEIAKRYIAVLPQGITVQAGLGDIGRMAYRFVVIAPDLATRDALHRHMEKAGVGCIVPIERYELLHRYLNLDSSDFPVAERLADTTLSLPIHSSLTDTQVRRIAWVLSRFNP